MNVIAGDFFDDLIVYLNLEERVLKGNEIYFKCIKNREKNILGKKESDFLKSNILMIDKNVIEDFPLFFEETIEIEGSLKYFKTKKEIIIDNKTQEKQILITRRNITRFKQDMFFYEDYKKLLEYIAKAKPIKFILNEIIKSVEKQDKNIICSIFLLDEKKERLVIGSAPSLPDIYNEKMNRIKIGEKVGSCGASVFLKKRIVVDDISTHENWAKSKDIALASNLHACWSEPFLSSDNEVLGSFAIYYNKPKTPSFHHIQLIENIASITGLAVENYNNYIKAKKDKEEKIQQAQLLMHKTKQAMMGEMLENIAHQWRQPLSIISTYATGILIKKKCGIDTKDLEDEAFENINLNAQYLSNTIDDFRKYLLSNKESSHFKIKDALDHTLKLVDSRIKLENIKIIENINEISITNFENELIQVFMNIFNNSIDVLIELQKIEDRYIFIDVVEKQKNIIIKICDSGNGASNEIIKRIFEPYFTTKNQKLGTGIGLYMCNEIIEKHMKGTIKAKNNDRVFHNTMYHGLEFEITIPSNVKN
jgi:signal transduction histidine kinase